MAFNDGSSVTGTTVGNVASTENARKLLVVASYKDDIRVRANKCQGRTQGNGLNTRVLDLLVHNESFVIGVLVALCLFDVVFVFIGHGGVVDEKKKRVLDSFVQV